MARTAPPACPVCGAVVQPMRDMLATLAERGDQARAVAARRRAEPPPSAAARRAGDRDRRGHHL